MTDFERDVRQTMTDVVDHTEPAPDFAARLIANSREGRVLITPIERARRGSRWTTPLLAAAIVILLAVGVVLGKDALSSHNKQRPVHPSPTVTRVPSNVTSPVPSPTRTTPVTTHPGYTVQSVYFSDPHSGWSLGTQKGKAALLRTTDGSTWSNVPLPPGLPKPSDTASCGTNGTVTGPCVDNVLFADAEHGYLWSLHELYTTDNGGRSWSRTSPSGQPGTAELVLFGTHVLRMTAVNVCSSGCVGQLQIASVGSPDWTTVTPTTSALFQSHIVVQGKTAYFESGDYAGGKGGGVYRSTNGTQWTNIAGRPCGDAYYELTAGFDGSVAVNCGAAHQTAHVADAGSSTFGPARRLPGSSASIVALLSAQDILAIDGRTMYRSTNGGASFMAIGTVDVDTAHGVTPTAVSVNFIYAPSVTGQLLVSTDGGATWQSRRF